MEVIYQREPDHHYMLPKERIPEDEGYILPMLAGNVIPGLLRVGWQRMNGSQSIRYDITAKQPLETMFARQGMGSRDIVSVLEGLAGAFESARAFLLNPADILLTPGCMYMDQDSRETFFCYLPGYSRKHEGSFDELSEFILRHLDHEDRRAVDLGYGFYEQVSKENFSFSETVKQLLADGAAAKGEETVREDGAGKGACAETGERRSSSGKEDPFSCTDKVVLAEEYQTKKGFRLSWDRKSAGKQRRERGFSVKERGKDGERRGGARGGRRTGRKGLRAKKVTAAILAAAVYGLIIWIGHLDLTQIGGLTFLCVSVGWLIYGTVTGRREKNRNHWLEDVEEDEDEEAFMEQLMSEVGDQGDGLAPEENGPMAREDMPLAEREKERFGQTRVLSGALDLPQVTLASETMRYPSLRAMGEVSLIGKQAESVDLVLPRDPSLSRIHAKLECTADGIFLTDMNSTNGTAVNGRQIGERTALHPGDRVSFAGLCYRVRIADRE